MTADTPLTSKDVPPLTRALEAAARYHLFGEYANEDQRHVVALALEIARLRSVPETG